jgi:hypothetical protein
VTAAKAKAPCAPSTIMSAWRVPLDKVEGFVKAQNTFALREHR